MKPCIDSKPVAAWRPRISTLTAEMAGVETATTAKGMRTDGSRRTWLAGAVAVLLLAQQGNSHAAGIDDGRLPDGSYHCEVYLLGLFLDLGTITIRGNVYSGPTYGSRTAQGYNYQIDPNGEVAWLGPLGGFTSGGNSVSLTQVTAAGETDASFDIIMRQADGAFTAATCTIQPDTR